MNRRRYSIRRLIACAALPIAFLLPSNGEAADKLLVKDGFGEVKFNVRTDDPIGMVGIGTGTPAAILDISPQDAISTDAIKVTAADAYNDYQFKVQGHVGGVSHVQLTSDRVDGRMTMMSSAYNDFAPRFHLVGPNDSIAPSTSGWAMFDFGSHLYDLPGAQFLVRHINNNATEFWTDMFQIIGSKTVAFPNGNIGIGITNPTQLLELAGGAYSDGLGWYDASSREYKENIAEVSAEDALETLENLKPVTFNYKQDNKELHAGFIAEDVPDLVATKDRKSLKSLDITAVLTKVVQEQQKTIAELQQKLAEMEIALDFKEDKNTTVASSK